MRPRGFGHFLPRPEGFQPPIQHPLRLLLLCRNESHSVLIQTRSQCVRLNRRVKTGSIFLTDQAFDLLTHDLPRK